MNIVIGILLVSAAFVMGVWVGWYAAHVGAQLDADLATYLSTGSLPALTLSAGEGAARPEPPTRAGRASPET